MKGRFCAIYMLTTKHGLQSSHSPYNYLTPLAGTVIIITNHLSIIVIAYIYAISNRSFLRTGISRYAKYRIDKGKGVLTLNL